jgi:serine/threonine protein kinase
MADVYLAYDPHFEREVAVKIFKREDEEMLRRFEREAKVMASLHNPHLIPVYDSGSSLLDGGYVYYIVMPYMKGGTLRSRIRNSPLPLKTACQYLREIADALDYMHQQGIIHRDIKSSNILLDADERCYLADFGIARASAESTQLTTAGSVLGTVDYLAPELFVSNSPADKYSDYYSLGVLLYEMVTGQLPFIAENQIAVIAMHVNKQPPSPLTYVPDLPPAVESVLLRALEKQPEHRYGSATELANGFSRALRPGQAGVTPTRTQNTVSPTWVTPQTQYIPPPSTRSAPVPNNMQYRQTGQTGQTRQTRQAGQAGQLGPYGYPVSPVSPVASAPDYYIAQAPVYPPQPPRGPDPKMRTQTSFVTIIVLLALLAVISPIVYFFARGTFAGPGFASTTSSTTKSSAAPSQATGLMATQQAQNAAATVTINSTATAQAVSASATQQAQNASATAVVGATATAQVQASATAGVIQTAVATNPTYIDALTNKDDPNTQHAQWDQKANCVFQTDGYHVSTGLLSVLSGCRESGNQFQNFAAQVDVTINKGASGGIFFRMNTNTFGAYKGYLFEVNANGQYRISRSKNFSTSNSAILRNWTDTPTLKNGAKNTLQVIARDATLSFYINAVFLGPSIQDQTFAGGRIAFLATADKGNQADVVYSNLSVFP